MGGLIVAGGPVSREGLQSALDAAPDLIIAADAGGKYLLELGVYPEILVGDLDSLPAEMVAQITAAGKTIRRYPSQKDQTDLQLALDVAAEAGMTAVAVWGALGGRIDHTLGNIALLQYAAEAGISVRLCDSDHELFLAGKHNIVAARPGWAISLLPLSSEVTGVITSGLKYPLNRETLDAHATRGIHNQFTAAEAVIIVGTGHLLIICFREQ
jgi:thiamine pyrophosphokinase